MRLIAGAFGAVSSFTDRVWIHSNGSMAPIQLSEQQMTSCASGCDGCSGCDAGPAYEYIQKTGLTTGGQTPFSSPAVTAAGGSSFPQECYPYTQPTCAESQQVRACFGARAPGCAVVCERLTHSPAR